MMMRVYPSVAEGSIFAPPSKSMAHRLLICAGLSRGCSVIRGVEASEDILATLDCLRALGAVCDYDGETVRVTGIPDVNAGQDELLCRESGSTLRFMIPLCLLGQRERTLRGSAKLLSRPLSVYETLCGEQGLSFQASPEGVTVRGAMKAGEYSISGSISSQFVSGLLFALPLLEGESVLKLQPPVESRPYIDMTLQALRDFGIVIEQPDENSFRIPGGQQYESREMTVEGDCSNAAFLEALSIAGGHVEVDAHCEGTLQGDAVYPKHIAALRSGSPEIDLTDCPDLGPVLFAVAAACHGARFTGTRRLRLKESDRVAAMAQELAKFGIRCGIEENAVEILPGQLEPPREILHGHNDHRIVMSMAVLCTLTGGIIDDAQAVRKSYPGFWEQIGKLKVRVEPYGMDQ